MEDEDKQLVLSYRDQQVVLSLNNSQILSLTVGPDQVWKAIALTWNTTVISVTDNSTTNAIPISTANFITNFSAVTVGRNFIGLIQDVIIYNTPLQDFTLPQTGAVLPQCYCEGNTDSSGDCVEDGQVIARYVPIIITKPCQTGATWLRSSQLSG